MPPTSRPSWDESLARTLKELPHLSGPPRLAVVGIGHELRGDDAAGIMVAHALRRRLPKSDALVVIDAGSAPENHTGALRRFKPDLVLLVDAAQMDEPPGTVRWLDYRNTSGLASSHTLPPHILIQYLTSELGCRAALIGIQPGDTAIGVPLSPELRQAVGEMVRRFLRITKAVYVRNGSRHPGRQTLTRG